MKNISFAVFYGMIIYLMIQSASAQIIGTIQFREICFKAFKEKNPKEIRDCLPLCISINKETLNGYQSIALMLEAKKSFSPFEKLKYFNEGKELLELTIAHDRFNLELRFLRFCVQTNLPFYLGYSGNIGSDKEFIIKNWCSLKDADLKKRIKAGMINSSHCNIFEKGKFSDG